MVQVIRTEGTVLVVSSGNEAQRVVEGMILEPSASLVAPQGAIVVLEDGTQLVVPQGSPIEVEMLLAESRSEELVDPAIEALRAVMTRRLSRKPPLQAKTVVLRAVIVVAFSMHPA